MNVNYFVHLVRSKPIFLRTFTTNGCKIVTVLKSYLPKLLQQVIITRKKNYIMLPGYILAGCCFSKSSTDSLVATASGKKYQSFRNLTKYVDSNTVCCVDNANETVSDKKLVNCLLTEEQNSEEVTNVIQDQVKSRKRKIDDKNEAVEIQSKTAKQTEDECDSSKKSVVSGNKPKSKTLQYQDLKPRNEKLHSKAAQRPNYFVAVKISDPHIHQALQEVQQHILKQDNRLKCSMCSLSSLHITLMVMYIGDEEEHQRAMQALHDSILNEEVLKLEFKGLGQFANKVLYANLVLSEDHNKIISLAKNVRKHFENAAIHSSDKKGFTPHLTIAKLKNKKALKNIKTISPALYAEYKDQYFGVQIIKSIQLLKMQGPKDEFGYYNGDEILFPSCTRSSVPETEDKKQKNRQYSN